MRARHLPSIALLAAVLGPTGCATGPAGPGHAEAPDGRLIVAMEGRFAAASRERGARAAFLEFLAEDSIVLQPGPVFGRAAWESAEDTPGTLDWVPDRAVLAADGEIGFSTGPWVLVPAGGGGSLAEGRYLSVWRHGPGGWQVVFDGGFGRRPGDQPVRLVVERVDVATPCERGPAITAGTLQSLDRTLSGTAFEPHGVRVSSRRAEGGALFHATDVAGASGPEGWSAVMAGVPVTTQLWPLGGAAASSGDLGYTYGLSSPALDEEADASYVDVWCRQGGEWRLLAQLRRPLPH